MNNTFFSEILRISQQNKSSPYYNARRTTFPYLPLLSLSLPIFPLSASPLSFKPIFSMSLSLPFFLITLPSSIYLSLPFIYHSLALLISLSPSCPLPYLSSPFLIFLPLTFLFPSPFHRDVKFPLVFFLSPWVLKASILIFSEPPSSCYRMQLKVQVECEC